MHAFTRLSIYGIALMCVVAGFAGAQSTPIIENRRPLLTPAQSFTLAPRPTLVIGSESAPEDLQFSRGSGAARLRDGRFVVVDGGSSTLRFFNATGQHIKSVGRRGAGPGEFSQLDAFWLLPGDTLAAGSSAGDISYFTGSGQYLYRRSTRNPPTAFDGPAMVVTLLPLDGGGTRLLGAVALAPQRNANRSVDSIPVAIADSQNKEVRRWGRLPFLATARDGAESRPPWFGAVAAFAANEKFVFVGFGSDYRIHVFTRQGTPVRTITRAWTPVKVTKADIDTYVVEWGKRWIKSTGAEAQAERDDLRDDPYAATVPAYSQFIADRVGRLWVREPHLADAAGSGQLNSTPLVPSRWSVFDASGRWLCDVTMPGRFMPFDIGSDYVLGKALDEDDVATIALYPLRARR